MSTSPQSLCTHLEWIEVDGARAPDLRRVISAERQALAVALASGNGAKIQAAAKEAERVARMWGVAP